MPCEERTDPLDMPLPCAVKLPGVVFGKGVSLRTLVEAAARWKAMADKAAFASLNKEAMERFRREMGHG